MHNLNFYAFSIYSAFLNSPQNEIATTLKKTEQRAMKGERMPFLCIYFPSPASGTICCIKGLLSVEIFLYPQFFGGKKEVDKINKRSYISWTKVFPLYQTT